MLISWKCLLRGKEEGEAPPPPPLATCLKIKRCGKYVIDVFFVFMRMCTGSWILKLRPTSYKIQSFVIKLSSLVKIHIIIKPKSLIDFIKYWDCYLCDCALALSFSLILWIISCNKYFFPIEILKNLISKIKNLKKFAEFQYDRKRTIKLIISYEIFPFIMLFSFEYNYFKRHTIRTKKKIPLHKSNILKGIPLCT